MHPIAEAWAQLPPVSVLGWIRRTIVLRLAYRRLALLARGLP